MNKKNTMIKAKILIKKSFTITLLVIFIFTVCPPFSVINTENVQASTKEICITAHRGDCSDAPENTLRSIRAAIKTHANFAELDVQESKDGQVVLTHDSNFKRTAGINKNVWELNYSELRKMDVGRKFSKKYKGEMVPTLDQVVKASKNKIKLNIEIKVNGHEKNLVKSVVRIIEDNHFENQCVVTSFDYPSLKQVRHLNKNIKIGYLIYKEQQDFSKLDVDFYSIDSSRVTADFINKAHAKHRQVFVWTVNNKDNMNKFSALGVDNIITDNPKLAKQVINSKYNIVKLKDKLDNLIRM